MNLVELGCIGINWGDFGVRLGELGGGMNLY